MTFTVLKPRVMRRTDAEGAVTDAKFCKDCRFYQPNRNFAFCGFLTAYSHKWANCSHASVAREEIGALVTGKSETSCRMARILDRLCGREARYWEAA